MQQDIDERVDDDRSPEQHEQPDRQIDPSESVTLFAIALGTIGALAGLAAGFFFSSGSGTGASVLNCLIATLAGGSAGVVTGGTIGAAIGVLRGVSAPKRTADSTSRANLTTLS
ncbi:hypothetical protein QN219_14530 [Sinorhizobium sp. 7-81]|uniref:hypothetical protein n=1 Tax=Sinorhizobium sp. 8-89 TaxID=3049089 RepID=UPI0024C3D163|nr:hypothetical protein [Sinorhizobium sp. 8-89]MDK1491264.1 hypothetical protein [Sinorhizobium sp. 8-89]